MANNALPIAIGVLALAGIGVAIASSSGSTPEAKPPPARGQTASTTGDPPKSVVDVIVAAVASKDPAKMRQVADQIDAQGYPVQADDLRKAADIAAFLKSTGLTMPTSGEPPKKLQGDELAGPSRPRAWSPAPGLIDPMEPEPEVNVKRLLAQRVVTEMEKPRGTENRDAVRAFQAANGLKASGNYTPATAMCVAVSYGLVPPTPYWPAKGRVKARTNYVALLHQLADRDPQRAEEWTRAAQEIEA